MYWIANFSETQSKSASVYSSLILFFTTFLTKLYCNVSIKCQEKKKQVGYQYPFALITLGLYLILEKHREKKLKIYKMKMNKSYIF